MNIAYDPIAQTALISSTVLLIALVAGVAVVALGVYRARHSAARETQYRQLASDASSAQTRLAESSQATVAELAGLRTELTQVRQRLTEVERLLSQIG
ncbi:hypothetical protein O7606_02455 [Micromonospora sp. WMMD882]|uniref:hypothetical protein n=1 Tax=Micromonospora sp. WMMD882 TaxID=3015151 RepID=UPI00248C1547|nr:hypothetical protein [Micromonospora sp. WMMD882]WBB80265.1 hypothetical protein O7606_02455 [Micromonospora sp. WMMD882]